MARFTELGRDGITNVHRASHLEGVGITVLLATQVVSSVVTFIVLALVSIPLRHLYCIVVNNEFCPNTIFHIGCDAPPSMSSELAISLQAILVTLVIEVEQSPSFTLNS